MHIARQWEPAGPGNFSLDGDRRGVNLCQVPVDQNAIPRIDFQVFRWRPGQGFAEINAEDSKGSVRFRPEKLRGFQIRILCRPSRQKNCILEPDLSRSLILARFAYVAANPNAWRQVKVIPAEDAHCIEWLKLGCGRWISHCR